MYRAVHNTPQYSQHSLDAVYYVITTDSEMCSLHTCTLQCAQCTVCRVMCSVYSTTCTSQCQSVRLIDCLGNRETPTCTLHTTPCTRAVCSVQCAVWSVQLVVWSVQLVTFSVQCTVCNVQYLVQCSLRYSTLHWSQRWTMLAQRRNFSLSTAYNISYFLEILNIALCFSSFASLSNP